MFEILKTKNISALCGGKYKSSDGYEAADLFLNNEASGFCIYKITGDLLIFAELEFPGGDPPLGDALLRAVLNIAMNKHVYTADFAGISENPAAARYGKTSPFDIAEFFENNNCPCGC